MQTNLQLPDNVTLEFTGTGVKVRVSLNISPELAKYVSVNNLYKRNKLYTYALSYHIDSRDITKSNIEKTWRWLLDRCMENTRKYKAVMLTAQSLTYTQKELEL